MFLSAINGVEISSKHSSVLLKAGTDYITSEPIPVNADWLNVDNTLNVGGELKVSGNSHFNNDLIVDKWIYANDKIVFTETDGSGETTSLSCKWDNGLGTRLYTDYRFSAGQGYAIEYDGG